jgi:hypothetical protein
VAGGATALDQEAAPFQLPAHADVLQEAVRAIDQPRAVILDPLNAFLASDAQGGADANAVVAALADTARSYGVAVVAIGHLTKERAHRTLYRVRGSLGYIAAARNIHLLSVDGDDSDRRVLCSLKSVHGPAAGPLAFRIEAGPRVVWAACGAGAVGDAGRLAPDLLDLSAEARCALSDAYDWLSDCLAAGPRSARDILREARAAGHSTTTLRRAKRMLGARSVKPSTESGWLWVLKGGTSV